eukprot:GEMP01047019.1.p1 GENE.GEMP01047019.1~~GEMP01047019.1.p1  ORF type:complete len:211 (+),score=33.26 GEMP01047019.1:47-679(+)
MPLSFDGITDAIDHIDRSQVHGKFFVASRWATIGFWTLSATVGIYSLFRAVSGGARGFMEIIHLISLGFMIMFVSFVSLHLELQSTQADRKVLLLKGVGYFFYSTFLFYPIPNMDDVGALWLAIFWIAGTTGLVIVGIQVYLGTVGTAARPLQGGRQPLRPAEVNVSGAIDSVTSVWAEGVSGAIEKAEQVARNPFDSVNATASNARSPF